MTTLLNRVARPVKAASRQAQALVIAGALTVVAGAPSASAEDIKIGVPLSLSGSVAFAGTKMREAMELAFEEVNSSGYLGANKLVPVWADDRSSQPQGISVTQQLALRDNVSAIVGYTASNICLASLPVAQELKVPTLQSDCVVPGLDAIGNYVYNGVRPYESFVLELVDKLVPAKQIKTAAVIYLRENPVFTRLAPAITKAFEKNGVKVVATEAVTGGGDADFSAQLTAIANTKPDILAILTLGGQVGPVMVQARRAGMEKTLFIGEQSFDSADVRRIAGPNAAGAYYPSHWFADSPLPRNQAYVKAYRAKYNRDPDTFATNGYNGVWLIAQIVKKAGSGDRAKILAAMESPGVYETVFGTEGKTKFENRMLTMTPFFFTIGADGKIARFEGK
ncbi:MAG TPA: ABC transporter substrate-binding protein [Xanthobacteraceae bacterium]|nr:ABC transporter substrate-binding protein [Xanthobacteraceae bacterium]